jgi:hypothetical protein
MAALSDYLENALINHVLRNIPYTSPGLQVWVALFDGDPGDDGLGATEVAAIARMQVTAWDPPLDGQTQNSAVLTLGPALTPCTVAGVGIFDNSVGGNLLAHGPSTLKTLAAGDSYQFAAGALEVTLA